jgi:hypothetical protein
LNNKLFNISCRILVVLGFATCMALPMPLLAQSDAIGKVIAVKGDVRARSGDGSLRNLARRSDLYLQDTILVGANGQAQVRMLDDAQFAFRANTEFSFDS